MSDIKDEKLHKQKLFSGLFQKIKTAKYSQYVIAAVLGLIVIILFLSSCSNLSNNESSKKEIENTSQNTNSILAYSELIEHKLENVLNNLKNCSNVNVMVVAQSSPIITIAEQTEEKITSSGETTVITKYPIYIENGSNKTPMVLYESAPKITGVLVIANGAGDVNVRLNIISAIQALLGIESSKIEVLEGN